VLPLDVLGISAKGQEENQDDVKQTDRYYSINACLVCTSHEHDWIDCCPAYEAYLTLVPAVRAINDSKLEGTLESENRSGAINLHETEVGTRQGQVVHEVH
jgi:hypothetical protein